jgi:NADH-quinone oxidoreductase subunit J
VLFLFVVMLLNTPREEPPAAEPGRPPLAAGPRRAGAVLAALFLVLITWAVVRVPDQPILGGEDVAARVSSVAEIGRELFTTHVFAFEVTTVLLLVAMIGAVVLAKRHL